MNYKTTLLLCAAVALNILGITPAWSQGYPAKPIKIIVPASAGTSTDAIARFFTEALSTRLKVPVVVENMGGAGGLLAYNAVGKAASDGYTLMLSGLPLYLLPLEDQGRFDSLKDFTPISRVARISLAIVVHPDSPYRSLADLVSAMKAKPNDLTYSSQGIGSAGHLCGALLNETSHTTARHVAYKLSSAAVTDVLGGHISFSCQGSGGVLPLVQSGKLRALTVTSTNRWDALPDVPTVAEAGYPGLFYAAGSEFIGPAGLTPSVVKMLSDAILETGNDRKYSDFLAKNAISLQMLDHKALAELMPKEVEYWTRLYAIANRSPVTK